MTSPNLVFAGYLDRRCGEDCRILRCYSRSNGTRTVNLIFSRCAVLPRDCWNSSRGLDTVESLLTLDFHLLLTIIGG